MRASAWCAAALLLATAIGLVAPSRQSNDNGDPLLLRARSLVADVRDFLAGKTDSNAVQELHSFLQSDAEDLAQAGIGEDSGLLWLGPKRGGWRRQLAFQEGAMSILTDVISEVGHSATAAAAARCLAMIAAANSKVREEASTLGTIKLLIKMVSQSTTNDPDWSNAQAAGAEAIWSLVYYSKANHAEALRRGAIPAMANLARTTENEWTRMWAMACLHNMAEDYCQSTTGHCPWVQVTEGQFLSSLFVSRKTTAKSLNEGLCLRDRFPSKREAWSPTGEDTRITMRRLSWIALEPEKRCTRWFRCTVHLKAW